MKSSASPAATIKKFVSTSSARDMPGSGDGNPWDAHMAAAATKEFREKLNALRNAPADDRFHNSLSVGPMEDAPRNESRSAAGIHSRKTEKTGEPPSTVDSK